MCKYIVGMGVGFCFRVAGYAREKKTNEPCGLVEYSAQNETRRKNVVWACEGVSAQVNQREKNPCGLVVGPNMTGCR